MSWSGVCVVCCAEGVIKIIKKALTDIYSSAIYAGIMNVFFRGILTSQETWNRVARIFQGWRSRRGVTNLNIPSCRLLRRRKIHI
jgi:hypothetical protein